jgi:hypothetical protein
VAAGAGAEVLHHQQGGEDGEDLVGVLGVVAGVALRGDVLAPAPPAEELLGPGLDGLRPPSSVAVGMVIAWSSMVRGRAGVAVRPVRGQAGLSGP